MVKPPATPDFILPFQFRDLGLRGRLVRLGTVADTVLRIHDYPDSVGELLAQALALSAALAGALKFDGVFTLQTKGNGPVSMMVADTTSAGEMRGCVTFDAARLAGAGTGSGPLGPVPRLLGSGHLAFTVDQGPNTERYQGIVELVGATLADCAHQYLRQSEQIESCIRLAAAKFPGGEGTAWRAGVLMLQRLPAPESKSGFDPNAAQTQDAAVEGWNRATALMSAFADGDLMDDAIGPYHFLDRVFPGERINVADAKALVHRCRCSELRVQRALASIPADQLESLKTGGRIEVVCQFCKASYVFDDAALRRFRAAG